MDQFPQMLYRFPGLEAMHGASFATRIVDSAEELRAALADGWSESTDEAKAAHEAAIAAAAKPHDEHKPPTRAELEQKATELGIEFKPATSNKKLAEAIDAKLKGG